MSTLKRLTLCVFLITSLAAAANAQVLNRISGFVFGPDRRPVVNIYVELLNEFGSIVGRTRTDSSGLYGFSGMGQGRYTIRVLASTRGFETTDKSRTAQGANFEDTSQEVDVINTAIGGRSISDNVQRDFYLRIRRADGDTKQVVGTVFAQEIPKKAREAMQKAVESFEKNRHEEGMEKLLEAVRIFPDYFKALELLGLKYLEKQNYELAWAVFLKAASVNEKSYNAWYGMAYSAYARNELDKGLAAATRATELNPGSADALVLLGTIERLAKQFTKAEETLLKAKTISDKNPDLHWQLALLYGNNLNRFKEAADELELYLSLSPNAANREQVRRLIADFRERAAAKP